MIIKIKTLSILLIIIIIVGVFTGCNSEKVTSFQSIEDFDNAKIGVLTGSSHDKTVQNLFPNANRIYFNNMSDMILAVEQGKIDCYIEDEQFIYPLHWEGIQLEQFGDVLGQMSNGFVFPQGETSKRLREQINSFIAEAKADGTIEHLRQKWFGETEPTDTPDYTSLKGENGTIHLAVSVDNKPILYQNANGFTGFEMELLTEFGKRSGYKFDIDVVPFESIIAGISANKYDMGASSLNITAEREESVDFSDPYGTFDTVIVIKGGGNNSSDSIKDLDNAVIGIVTGTTWDTVVQREFPNAERKYFTTTADVLLALLQGKVDTFLADKTVYCGTRWENDSITYIDQKFEPQSNALIFSKDNYDEKLFAQINEFIAESKNNGTLDILSNKWFGDTEPDEHPDYSKLTGKNGTLRIAVGDSQMPVSYKKGSAFTGYEVEFLTLFAEKYGYKLEIQGMAFNALIPSIASGKCDIGASGITITPERAESVQFSDPHIETYGVAVIRKSSDVTDGDDKSIKSIDDVNGKKVAIFTGTIWDGVVKKQFPDAERMHFSLMTDMILALNQRKVDVIIGDDTFYVNALWENVPISILDDKVGTVQCGIILPKNNYDADLLKKLNEFIAQSKADGTMDKLRKKWLSDKEPTEHPDYRNLSGENGTIKVAVENAGRPMTYQKNNGFTGLDVEFLTLFAEQYGYSLEFSGMAFEALIPTISSGKCDLGMCGIGITDERAESVKFTDSYFEIYGTIIVSDSESKALETGFFDEVLESFEKTFIREDRWKLIVEGIGVTMLISLCAAAAGSLLGFGLYMLSRSDLTVIRMTALGVAKVYSRIVAGTPIVVILMILFYVIFGKVRDMSGIVVAIIGFTLTFGAFVYDHMTVSVSSVDRGQTEAAYALGYTKNQTFFRIVFPQAMKIFLPSYCGQTVELIKATAVVGYIAVNDLTKMGDIIRSNTYEAFFPLIATAVIYFVLTWVLSLLLQLVKVRFEPKRRSAETILKGVKTK